MELGDEEVLQAVYANQSVFLESPGQEEEALSLLKQAEAICRELNLTYNLPISWGKQAAILRDLGRLEEARDLLRKQEAACLVLGYESNLGICYANWGLLARAQGDRKTEREKLEQALVIFTELKMARQRDYVRKELEKVDGG